VEKEGPVELDSSPTVKRHERHSYIGRIARRLRDSTAFLFTNEIFYINVCFYFTLVRFCGVSWLQIWRQLLQVLVQLRLQLRQIQQRQ